MSEEQPTFLGVARGSLDDLARASVAIFGAAHASPDEPGQASASAGAAGALRRASAQLPARRQYDYDIGGVLMARDDERGIVDLGDLPTDPSSPEENRRRITDATRRVLEAGAVPVLLGGDDSVPIPAFAAYEGRGPLTVLQIDAHVDWADVVKGNPFGYGSTMRRAAEMPWITHQVQVGIRGLGSGSPDQLEDARRWGSRIVTMADIRREGIAAAIDAVPAGQDCIVTIDFDGLDPSIMPAVAMPGPGGLLYGDTLDLLQGVAAKAHIAGYFAVEFVPERDDPHGLAALTAARVVLSGIGLIRGIMG